MVLHMLAVFGRGEWDAGWWPKAVVSLRKPHPLRHPRPPTETAHPPTLIESEEALKKTHQPVLADEERQTQEVRRVCLAFHADPIVVLPDQPPGMVPLPLPTQALCAQIMDPVFAAAKPASRNQEALGKGSAFLYETSPYCSYAQREGVHVLFSGEVGGAGRTQGMGEALKKT